MAPEPAGGEVTEGPTVLSHAQCRIGLWGLFDVDDYGAMVEALVTRHELLRRLPAADVRLFAPLGDQRPCRLDGGEEVEPLGAWGEHRLAELAGQLDCVVVGGPIVRNGTDLVATYGEKAAGLVPTAPRFFVEGLGAAREDACPLLWHAVGFDDPLDQEEAERLRGALSRRPYVTVRGELSKRCLDQAGLESPIAVAPDAAFLLPRLFAPDVLAKRLDYLRLMGWYPREERAVVVHGDDGLLAWVPELASSLVHLLEGDERLSVVVAVLAAHGGEDEFATALAAALPPERTSRLPPAGSADVAAALASSAAFVGRSRPGCVTAIAYGRPTLLLGPAGMGDGMVDLPLEAGGLVMGPIVEAASLAGAVSRVFERGPDPQALVALQVRADTHLDRVAELAAAATSRRAHEGSSRSGDDRIAGLEARLASLGRAHRVRGDRLFAERVVYADRVADLTHDLRAAREDANRVWRQLNDEVPRRIAAEEEIEALRTTRTFRWTARLRAAYRRLRPSAR